MDSRLSYILLLVVACCFGGCKSDQKLNIILIYADDLGWTDLGVQGSSYYQTPNIDKLASDSYVFTNAYANAANCAPSRACMMTGLYTPRHGVYTVSPSARGKTEHRKLIPTKNTKILDSSFEVFPQILKADGYKTCMAGKWHISDDARDFGFDENFGGYASGHPKSYFSPYKNPQLEDGPEGEYLSERLTRDSKQWLIENKDDPFFLYFSSYLVHTPNQPKKELLEKYESIEGDSLHNVPSYAAMVEALDNSVGILLNTLDSLGIADNTVVIFSSDNGPMGANSIARPLRGTKGMMYDGGIRIPFFMRLAKERRQSKTIDAPIIGLDLFPTMLGLAGISAEDRQMDGESIMPLLKNNETIERPLFWHFPAYLQGYNRDKGQMDSHDPPHWRSTPCSVVRQGEWKLHHFYENDDLELYNLREDISESNDLSQSNPSKTKELKSLLKNWIEETNAPIPSELNPDFR